MLHKITFDPSCIPLINRLSPYKMTQLRHLIGSYNYFLHYDPTQFSTEGTVENDYFYILHCGDIRAALLNYTLHIDTAFCKCLIHVINKTMAPPRLTRHPTLNEAQNTFIHIAYLNKLLYQLYNGVHNCYDNQCINRPLYNKITIQNIVNRFMNNPLNDDPFGFNNRVVLKHIINNNSSGELITIWGGSTYKAPFDVLKTNIHAIKNNTTPVHIQHIQQLHNALYVDLILH